MTAAGEQVDGGDDVIMMSLEPGFIQIENNLRNTSSAFGSGPSRNPHQSGEDLCRWAGIRKKSR